MDTVVTLTANPSLDRTIGLAGPLRRGEVHRAVSVDQQPGGKGVNVSRAAIASGLTTIAVLPGGPDDPLVVAMRGDGIPAAFLPIAQRTRSNVTVTEPDGTTTKLNEPGPVLTDDDDAALIALVIAHCADAAWLVLAGSLPPGLADDFYARVVEGVRAAGLTPRIAVDSSGAPLRALVDSGVGVDLLKPNAEELAELTDRDGADLEGSGLEGSDLEGDVEQAWVAARDLLHRGCGAVLATLGAQGAILATTDGGWQATMPTIVPRSTVGAGDAALAGYLLADLRGLDHRGRLAQAVAHGSAAAALPGSTMPSAAQTAPGLARIRRVESAGSITEPAAPTAAAPTTAAPTTAR